MEQHMTNRCTGLQYELVGNYYLVSGDDNPEEQQPIGVWGNSICGISKSIVVGNMQIC